MGLEKPIQLLSSSLHRRIRFRFLIQYYVIQVLLTLTKICNRLVLRKLGRTQELSPNHRSTLCQSNLVSCIQG
jgi:hypothetical protein